MTRTFRITPRAALAFVGLIALALAVLCMPRLAHAQAVDAGLSLDAGIAATLPAAPVIAAVPDVTTDPAAFIELLASAGKGAHWLLLGVLVLVGACSLVTKFGAKLSPALATNRAKMIVSMVTGALLALIPIASSGVPLTLGSALLVTIVSAAAGGAYNAYKQATKPEPQPAPVPLPTA